MDGDAHAAAGLQAAKAVKQRALSLKQRALSLGAANAFEYAAQFLLPVVLVRCLDTEAFGQYRLLWLAAGTVLAFAPLAMPASLYYFLPRSDGATKRLYVNQTLVFLAGAGLVAAWSVSVWNPWLPEKMHGFVEYGALVPGFVLLWVVASLLDLLPTVDERVIWQAKTTIGLATLRTVAVALTAIATRELEPVLLILLAFVVFKVALLLGYVAGQHGLRGPLLRWRAFSGQVRYAAPFGVAGSLYGMRVQADQWLAVALFSVSVFASLSIAAVLGPLLNLFRQSVNTAFLPSMSRLQASGDDSGMLELNSRANVLVAMLVLPLFGFIFVFAEEIVTIVYTAAYLDAAPLMRLYLVGLAANVVETATLTMLLRQGAFMLRLNLLALVLSIAIGWYLALHIGIAGVAVGGACAMYFDRIVTLRRIARCAGMPLRRLQDWPALGFLLLLAVLAAALAWGIVGRNFLTSGPWVRVILGGALLAAVYGALLVAFGDGRIWGKAPAGANHDAEPARSGKARNAPNEANEPV